MTEGVGPLIARRDSSGMWWFGVGETGDDEGNYGKDDLWK